MESAEQWINNYWITTNKLVSSLTSCGELITARSNQRLNQTKIFQNEFSQSSMVARDIPRCTFCKRCCVWECDHGQSTIRHRGLS